MPPRHAIFVHTKWAWRRAGTSLILIRPFCTARWNQRIDEIDRNSDLAWERKLVEGLIKSLLPADIAQHLSSDEIVVPGVMPRSPLASMKTPRSNSRRLAPRGLACSRREHRRSPYEQSTRKVLRNAMPAWARYVGLPIVARACPPHAIAWAQCRASPRFRLARTAASLRRAPPREPAASVHAYYGRNQGLLAQDRDAATIAAPARTPIAQLWRNALHRCLHAAPTRPLGKIG